MRSFSSRARRPHRPARFVAALLLSALVLPLLPPPAARAAPVCTVSSLADSGAGSLRQCLIDVDAGGMITFQLSGTITLASNLTLAKAVTIVGPGATIDRNNVSGNVFTLNNGGHLIASGLTLTGANFGVTVNTGASLVLTDSTVSGNANNGVYVGGGSATLTNVTSSSNGLGVQVNGGSATVTGSTISNNSNTGVQVQSGTATITNSVLSGNTSNGGVQVQSGSATITGSTFSGNSIGVWLQGGGATLSKVAISGSTSVNLLVQGGATATVADSSIDGSTYGVRLDNGSATLRGTTVSGSTNTAVRVAGGSATLVNSTVAGNTNNGVFVASGASATLRNSTISGNSFIGLIVESGGSATASNSLLAANTSANCFGTITNGGYNLDSGTDCGFGTANHSQSNAAAGLDPSGLQDNGGPFAGAPGNGAVVRTVNLLSTSAAHDAASDNVCAEIGPDKVNGVDQRGLSRPSGAHCDIGAVESDGTTYLVTTLADSGPGSLRAGWGDASVGTIVFPPEAGGNTIGLLTNLPDLDRSLRVIGPSPASLSLLLTSGSRVFLVSNLGKLTVDNLILSGSAPDVGVVNLGSLRLNNVILSGFDKGVVGNGTATLTNVTLSGTGTGVETAGSVSIINSTVSGNGTGIDISGNGVARLTNVTLSGNGTGVAHSGTVFMSLTNVTVSGNGTGVASSGTGDVSLANTLVANSTVANCSGTLVNDGHNLDSGTSCGFGSANGSKSSIPAGLDPAGLASNGGPTKTIALLTTSAAINAGDNALCAETGPGLVNGVDQRGVGRPQGAACDIGAFEHYLSCAVTTLADSGVGSLRECLPLVDSGGTITVGLTGTITLASDLPPVTRALTLTGPGANLLTIDRASLSDTAIFSVTASADLAASGLTLTGASKGVSVVGGGATLSNVALSGNATGVHLQGGNATLANVTLSGNGGGVVTTGNGGATLINATLSDNGTGVSSEGGGATLINVTLSHNTVGVARLAGSVTLTNTIVANSTNDDCTGTITDFGHNLDTDGTCGLDGGNNSLPAISAGLNPAGLANNGGPTKTIALLATSAAINKGDSAVCAETGPGKVNSLDQRGIARPQGLGCDIGAYEYVQPTIAALNPASARVGGTAFTLTVAGTNFQATSVVHWQGQALATTFVSSTSLTASVTSGQLAAEATAEITVITPGADGGSSAPWPFFVIPTNAPVTAVGSGSSGSSNGTAVATVGGSTGSPGSVSAAASGSGTVSVAQYAAQPAPRAPANATKYTDIYLAAGNTFTSVTIVNCNLGGGSVAYWWSGTDWIRVDPQQRTSPGCITITITASSMPNLAQLTGSYFAAAEEPTASLTVTNVGSGSIGRDLPGTGGGPFAYGVGTVVTLTPQPGTGQTFTGWTVDGVNKGWAAALTLTMDADHTVQATFAPTKAFPDVTSGRADFVAITELASRTTIRGYANGNYGPDDGVQRAQMAALIARATSAGPGTPPTPLTPPACLAAGTWDCEDWGNGFSDRNGLDANLWRDVGALQHYGVAFGYDGAACAARGVASPCYGPTAPVSYVETVVFITRAMIAKGYWVAQPAAPQPYAGVPAVFAATVATYHYYTGGVPAPPSDWNAGATRGWFARALWQALNTFWATDGTLPDGRNAGGFAP